jgi:hypothetical protein
MISFGSTSRRSAMAPTVRPFQLKADHVFVAQAFQPLDGGEFKIGFGATVGHDGQAQAKGLTMVTPS